MASRTSTVSLPFRPPRLIVRRDAGLSAYVTALQRAGFGLVAGADEAGRGACAGPLVVAACILPAGRRGEIDGLADSKLLTPAVRESLYGEIVRRATAFSVVAIPAAEVDERGLHVANLSGMRRALAALRPAPAYALTDGFPVARPRRSGDRGLEGRRRRQLHRRCVDPREGHARPDDGRDARHVA